MIKFKRTDLKYGVFSNFSPVNIVYDGIEYNSTEAAWQAQKCIDKKDRIKFSNMTPSQAKQAGRRVKLRPDWEDVKLDLMEKICFIKFSQSPFKEILLNTGNEEIVEDTTGWHDNIWGNCSCGRCANRPGKNLLGKTLMKIRDRLKEE